MDSFEELLGHWTATDLSNDLGVGFRTACAMKWRGFVDVPHWPALLRAAKKKGIQIDEAILIRIGGERKARRARNPAAASQGAA